MSFRISSSVRSPVPISLMPLLSSPRSVNCFMKIAPTPDGTNTKTASGDASRTRCRNGAKSGLRKGTRKLSTTCPPAAVKRVLKAFSASIPGP